MFNYLIDNSVMCFCVFIKVKMLCNNFKGFFSVLIRTHVGGLHVK